MGNNSEEVRLAPDGSLYVAPVGSVLPSNATVALDAAWEELGYIDEDGVSMTPSVDLSDIMMWQSTTAVKVTLDSTSFEIQFNMGQVNKFTWGLYFFNSNWTNNFGQAKLTLLSNPASQEKGLIVEWRDDEGDQNRLVLPKAVLTDREDLQLVRNAATLAGVTFKALDYSGVYGYVHSDNPDLLPSS